ncbi:MAG: ATP-binding protein [Ghiorsea sp.]
MSSKYENTSDEKGNFLTKLFIYRNIASVILMLMLYWFERYSGQQNLSLLQQVAGLWLFFGFIQFAAFRFFKHVTSYTYAQLISDLILIGYLIYGSGGLTSPFIFLLGLVIITAGSQARIILTLLITVLATATYIITIYSFADAQQLNIQAEDTIKILFQTSLFFLTGGIMAMIARRHALLKAKEKQTSSEHKQLQEIHSQVLQTMQEGIVILNADMSIQAFNPSAAQLLSLSNHQAGTNIRSIINMPDQLYAFSQHGELDNFRHEVSWHNHDLLLNFTKLHDDSSISWLLTLVNITETRSLERKLAEQDKLASIGQMAAMLAHEIRNPMQTISQAVELMGLEHSNTKLEHIVTDEISRLNRLVSDMLDYANPLHPKPQPTSILPLLHTSVEQVDLNKAHHILVKSPDINLDIDSDHFRLVLDNLLRNAIRVSPKPSSIEVSLLKEDNKKWRLSVRDHGAGISPEMRKTLFQPFQTGHKKGVGLGLATVWQVCHVNKWQIHIDTSINNGACFIIHGNQNDNNVAALSGVQHG